MWHLSLAVLVVAFYVLLVANVIVHELAHALVSKLVGFHTLAIHAGPLAAWWDPSNRFRVGFTGWTSSLLGGHVMTLPRTTRGLRWRCIAVLLAGPAASLCSMVACLTVFVLVADDPRNPTTFEWLLLLSAGVELTNLAYGGAFRRDYEGHPLSDGAHAVDLLRGSPWAVRGWRANVLLTALVEERRDAESAALVIELSQPCEGESIDQGQMAAANYELHEGRFELARQLADRMKADPKLNALRLRTLPEIAILRALDGDEQVALAALVEAKASIVVREDPFLAVTEAAVARDWDLACRRFDEWAETVRKGPDHVSVIASRRWTQRAFRSALALLDSSHGEVQ